MQPPCLETIVHQHQRKELLSFLKGVDIVVPGPFAGTLRLCITANPSHPDPDTWPKKLLTSLSKGLNVETLKIKEFSKWKQNLSSMQHALRPQVRPRGARAAPARPLFQSHHLRRPAGLPVQRKGRLHVTCHVTRPPPSVSGPVECRPITAAARPHSPGRGPVGDERCSRGAGSRERGGRNRAYAALSGGR
jgi:hypothetical protein